MASFYALQCYIITNKKMKFLIFIPIFFLFSSCQKEFGDSLQPVTIATIPISKPTAVFTFDGAPSNCTNISRAGMYTVGIPLSSLNKVKIDVNVRVPGSYTITTSLTDGFSFSGTGYLDTMGYGAVLLQATGTPLASGTFIFAPNNNGCPFSIYVYP